MLCVNGFWLTVNGALIKAGVYPLTENRQTKLPLPFLWIVPYMPKETHIIPQYDVR